MAPGKVAEDVQDDAAFWAEVYDDLEVDEDFSSLQQANEGPKTAPPTSRPANTDVDDLGLDEEVEPPIKRKPTVKLDTDRLLGQKGIPKLNRIAKTKLKLKGKGHEFSDAARILTMYQIWLHELFPKANFMDGLYLIEKLGHTRMIGEMRKTWIEEATQKAREKAYGQSGIAIREKEEAVWAAHKADLNKTGGDSMFVGREGTPPPSRDPIDARDDSIWDNDDMYNLTPRKPTNTVASTATAKDHVPDEDELDMLQSAQANNTSLFGNGLPTSTATNRTVRRNDEVEDEMDFWDV